MKQILFLILISSVFSISAQKTFTGIVKGNNNEPIAGATVMEKYTNHSTITDKLGVYTIETTMNNSILIFSTVGYDRKELLAGDSTKNVFLQKSAQTSNTVYILGSRNKTRTSTNTMVPVDVINIKDITTNTGQVSINQILHYVAPSFNVNQQSGCDVADHIDPAALRGMGPDQTLVLINGKRYHQSSTVFLYGTRGRGNTGTDMNTIPIAAIERIEILRDGAAAQYGSDAIAGVINIILKNNVDNLEINATNAAYIPSYNRFNQTLDGYNYDYSMNYGFKVLKKGFINLTLNRKFQDFTNRATTAPFTDSTNIRKFYGEPQINNNTVMINSSFPLSSKTSIDLVLTANQRIGNAYEWSKYPGDINNRNNEFLYPNGFDPIIRSDIQDYNGTIGLESNLGKGWNFNLSNTFGKNRFDFSISNTHNRSLGNTSPRQFYCGGYSLLQNTSNFHFDKKFAKVLKGLNFASGGEVRHEYYEIHKGDDAAYKNYNDTFPSGAQGFPGFGKSDEIALKRNVLGAFVDFELDILKNLSIAAAVRYENYSDFSNTIAAKFSMRYEFIKGIAIRGTVSNGFRAPSLPQIGFSQTITDYSGTDAYEVRVSRNTGVIAKTLGIPNLKQENSLNFSGGITAKIGKLFTISSDYYRIIVTDRIVLSGQFRQDDPDIGGILQQLNIRSCRVFGNAVNTTTQGVDVVAEYNKTIKYGSINFILAFNFNNLTIDSIHAKGKLEGKEDIYFDYRERIFLIHSAPQTKASFSSNFRLKGFNANLRFTHFGAIALANYETLQEGDPLDFYSPKITTDLSLSYKFKFGLLWTIGVNNLFNVYPDFQDGKQTINENGAAWDAVQMGTNGTMLFTKLRLNIFTKKK